MVAPTQHPDPMTTRQTKLPLMSCGQKLFLLAAVPLIFAMAILSALVTREARDTANREIAVLEGQLIAAKREELRNYLLLARIAFSPHLRQRPHDDAQAKTELAQILAAMTCGTDGFFFVCDYDGKKYRQPAPDKADREKLGEPVRRREHPGCGHHHPDRPLWLWLSRLSLAQTLVGARGANDDLCRRHARLASGDRHRGVHRRRPHGMPDRGRRNGLGLRNMAERMEHLDGTLRILSTRSGTVIEAQVPLTHMLPPSGSPNAPT